MTQVIAVLMTCHNRKAMTLRCLDRLFRQALPSFVTLRVYLVDDGSTDGSGPAVQEVFPQVTVIQGNGTLFWCEGTRLAWRHAAETDPEFYLWLNDDVALRPRALETLLAVTSNNCRRAVVVVGSCCDPATRKHTYGGHILSDSGHHPARLSPVVPDAIAAKPCDTFNGNCVLLTRAVFLEVGFMRRFGHAMGDTDYGLLARRNGIPVLIGPGYVAECTGHPIEQSWLNRTLSRKQRWQMLVGRKGLPPADWWRLLWTHAGSRALLYWPVPYLRVLVGR
jgi:GT2 family glycosyltransferase